MKERWNQSRRQWLGACASLGSATVLAGCFGSDSDDDSSPEEENVTGADWPMYGVDLQNTNYQSNATEVEGDELTKSSVIELDGISTHPITISEGYICGHSTGGKMFTIDIDTGNILWERENFGRPIIHDGTVYGPTTDERIHGYNIKNGDHWESQTIDSIDGLGYPLPTEEAIFVFSSEVLWKVDYETGEYTKVIELPPYIGGYSEWPAFQDGVIYMSRSSEMHAINVKTPEILWTFEPEGGGSMADSNPTIGNGLIYTTSRDQNLHAIEIESGNEVWSIDTDTRAETSPAFANDIVYLAESGRAVAVDADSGEIVWEDAESIIGKPQDMVIVGETCYTATRFGIWTHDASTGDLNWEYRIPDESDVGFNAPPTISDGQIYVPSDDEKLYSIGGS